MLPKGDPSGVTSLAEGAATKESAREAKGLTRFKSVCIQEGRPSKSVKKLRQQALMAYF